MRTPETDIDLGIVEDLWDHAESYLISKYGDEVAKLLLKQVQEQDTKNNSNQ